MSASSASSANTRSSGGQPPAKRTKTARKRLMGVVDPTSSLISGGEIVVIENDPCDCMLVKVNPSTMVDNFFVLQLVECTNTNTHTNTNTTTGATTGTSASASASASASPGNNPRYVVYKRFGSTGTTGTDEEQEFDDEGDAFESFEETFTELTGHSWQTRLDDPMQGKYSFIEQNFTEKQRGYSGASFQYYIDNGVDGKQNGWHDYDSDVNPYVEQLFHEYIANPQLTNRIMTMGAFTYNIDLAQMTQTNVKHYNKTSRKIRRCVKKAQIVGQQPLVSSVSHAPASAVSTSTATSTAITAVATAAPAAPVPQTRTPNERIPYTAPLNMIDIAMSKIVPVTDPISESDDTCVICLSEMTDDEDIVQFDMPDCNHIFHHDCIKKAIQFSKPCCPTCRKPIDEVQGYSPSGTMSISTTKRTCSGFESSIGTIIITYNLPSDTQKQYHPNPGVHFHGISRSAYIPDTQEGKDVLQRLKYAWRKGLSFTVGTSMTTGASNCITWSSIHHKTNMHSGAIHHGFPDANFFRNCNFELDALGVPEASNITTLPQLNQPTAAPSSSSSFSSTSSVSYAGTSNAQTLSQSVAAALRPMTAGGATPSHQQIQAGITILNEIKSKINGHNVSEGYASLSSRFYTVIPHSFGRRRPPVIKTSVVVQSTIDACNYLLQN
eukprot:CAMPEP_0203664872 /NCGR_PEP_ID=MMETSP0090-20130426/2199_1 /ASSEMBLY_ACC=CAM_ASM_001088 /TAXON_ID=426623 /ORGANISM="Chaetoceros affinis, Strain CCMP159" /LENGTH=665 /DNA_ID=CAMNT_0050528263 /DNA_START=21 /DNA_END=2018 /DNA_ORIENTATION=+